jgi:hypothetical protein
MEVDKLYARALVGREFLYIARTEYWIPYTTVSCVKIFSACRRDKTK